MGIGSGMFNSPNTAAMMGTVPPQRRGIAAGTRVMVQNTGAVISIAFVMAIVTASIPKDVLFKIFSGLAKGLSDEQLAPFIQNMHTALWVLAAVSLLGAVVSLMRPRACRVPSAESEPHGTSETLRIGDVAATAGTTTRTIRYYEEIGLLPAPRTASAARTAPTPRPTSSGCARCCSLKELLGVSLDELKDAGRGRGRARGAARRVARRARRDRRRARDPDEALGHIDAQLTLLRARRAAIEQLEAELLARKRRVQKRLRELA